MWIGNAKQLCPNLKVLPYDFAAIENASFDLMDVLTDVTSRVLPMSCDEVGMCECVDSIDKCVRFSESLFVFSGVRATSGRCRVSQSA